MKRPLISSTSLALAGMTGMAALAVLNAVSSAVAEKTHPPKGRFLNVDGVTLHYTDRGTGSPVVLIHGNAVSGDDFDISGLSDLLLKHHRVIIVDRPGFGHTKRPPGRRWTARQQAELLHTAMIRLDIKNPVIVGHSWGAIAALALASRHQGDIKGVVLLGGYYYPTARPDVLLAALGTIPFLGRILNHTTTPLMGRLTMPIFKRALFSPAAVPTRFEERYSPEMALRPSAVEASSADGAQMISAVREMVPRYKELGLPVAIFAGRNDKVVFLKSAERLNGEIPGSELHIVNGAGHMVHYVATAQVASAINDMASA